MNTFWNWLVKSSADPTQVALTAKGIISTVVPVLLVFVHNPNLSSLPDDVYSLIVAAFGVYSAIAIVFGLARKIYISLTVHQA
jgi:hypothetical protein